MNAKKCPNCKKCFIDTLYIEDCPHCKQPLNMFENLNNLNNSSFGDIFKNIFKNEE